MRCDLHVACRHPPRKLATFLPDLAMFISSTKSACVVKPSRELFWALRATSFFRIAEFSCRTSHGVYM